MGDDASKFSNRSDNSRHVVRLVDSFVTIDGFTIRGGNDSGLGGGGLLFDGPGVVTLTIRRCIFTDNEAVSGGGMAVVDLSGESLVIDTVFLNNRATEKGGGLSVALAINSTGSKFVNCIITGNTSGVGGGLFVIDASVDMINSTVFANRATDFSFGAGISAHGTGLQFHLFNSIIWNNTAMGGAMDELAQVTAVLNHDAFVIDHCCVQNLSSAFDLLGVNNTGDSPMFVDALGADEMSGTGDEDLRLTSGSACVDAGNNDRVAAVAPFDFDGFPRFADDPDTTYTGVGEGAIVDIGAFEFQAGGEPIPTLSSWSVLILTLGVVCAGTIILRQSARVASARAA